MHADFFYELKSYEILGQVFRLVLPFFSNRWLRVMLVRTLRKSIQDFRNARFLVSRLFYYN